MKMKSKPCPSPRWRHDEGIESDHHENDGLIKSSPKVDL